MGLYGHEELVNCVKFTPNGRLVVSCSDDRTVRLHPCESFPSVTPVSLHM